MTDELRILPIPESEKQLLRNLMQAYIHDLSEFSGDEPDALGSFGVGSHFDAYWIEPERHPLKITHGGRLAGFALVRMFDEGAWSVAEFFILRAHRRCGVGRRVAAHLFDMFPGTWHVGQDEANLPAQAFWRSVISEYTGGRFEEAWSEASPRGPKQIFESRRKA